MMKRVLKREQVLTAVRQRLPTKQATKQRNEAQPNRNEK
jgi:hypothetical protein